LQSEIIMIVSQFLGVNDNIVGGERVNHKEIVFSSFLNICLMFCLKYSIEFRKGFLFILN